MNPNAPDADTELKARHRALWALGDYPAVASQLIPELGSILVDACRIQAGEKVLDVAAGTGNASIPAALAGARVTATDLTPELLEFGRRDAEAKGIDLTWETADAEALPYPDAGFDVAMSCIGVMFAPHHQVSADELVRVVRPGGRIGLLNWTPAGFIGQLFATMRPFAPPPPPGALPPPLWGTEEHVRRLFGDAVTDVAVDRRSVTVDRFPTGEEFRDYFKANFGPTITAHRFIADQPGRAAELDRAMVELARSHDEGGGVMHWEYLLLTAARASS